MKPAYRSVVAEQDIESAVDFYLAESAQLAADFIDELERATMHIQAHAATGSPRYAHALNIPQLRFWMLQRFPYALFYVEHDDHLDVVRCVHLSRGIPASLQNP